MVCGTWSIPTVGIGKSLATWSGNLENHRESHKHTTSSRLTPFNIRDETNGGSKLTCSPLLTLALASSWPGKKRKEKEPSPPRMVHKIHLIDLKGNLTRRTETTVHSRSIFCVAPFVVVPFIHSFIRKCGYSLTVLALQQNETFHSLPAFRGNSLHVDASRASVNLQFREHL